MLPPQHRLRRSEDFRSVVRTGKRAGGRYVVAHVLTKSTRPTRVGFVVSKAVGNAATRNRVKRRMRHICAEVLEERSQPADIVVRALPRSSTATFTQLRTEMRRNLGKLGVLE
ncbi:MAG TPA: ribonuclease P protein component [Beutenbergiaceae bacterium]|nr:ribonuclease P protein component [Beutenbergiaceae bacterium]